MTFYGVYDKLDAPDTSRPTVDAFIRAAVARYAAGRSVRATALYGSGGSYVYFMKCEGFVKVGHAVNPTARMAHFQMGNPFALTILGVLPGGAVAERAIHKALAQLRTGGEWFRLTPLLESIIVENTARYAPSPLDVPAKKRTCKHRRIVGA